MNLFYYSSILFLIILLVFQQIFYIRRKYSQQNIKLIEYYLHTKLIAKLLDIISKKSSESGNEEIRKIIKKYYYLDEMIIYKLSEKKFDLANYDVKSFAIIKDNIDHFVNSLLATTHERLQLVSKDFNVFGIYLPKKDMVIFLIKQDELSELDFDMLSKIILPLYSL
jgi:hypothetical protein